MKVIVCGPKDYTNYEVVKEAIEKSGFEITEVVSGGAKGVDQLGERWAKENKIKYKRFPADWKNIKRAGAVIAEGPYGKYDKMAAAHRDEQMVDYADACIAIVVSNNTSFTAKTTEEVKKPVFRYNPDKNIKEEDYGYSF